MPRDQHPDEREGGRYTSEYSDADFLEALEKIEERNEVADTVTVAEQIECHRDTARRRLNRMNDEGLVERVEVGNSRLWKRN